MVPYKLFSFDETAKVTCNSNKCGRGPRRGIYLQADGWTRALHRSQQRMHSFTAGTPSAALEDLGEWDADYAAESASDPDAAAVEEVQGLPAPPVIEVSASLGELALFVSGRVCTDWWPPEVRSG